MSQNFKILFFLKKGRNRIGNSLPVYVRVTVDGERAEWSCQRQWDPSKWNLQTGRAVGNKNEVKILNNYLEIFIKTRLIFITLNNLVDGYKPFRLMDAFVGKLELRQSGFTSNVLQAEGCPPFAPYVMLK